MAESLTFAAVAPDLPTVDLSTETGRHVIVASGADGVYQGHPTTLLLPDGRTMLCVWTVGHGGPCGPLAQSHDGGRTWSARADVPPSWQTVRNCPAIYRLRGPDGRERLFVFAGQGPDGTMHQSCSEDGGQTWSEMRSNGLRSVMPFCSIVPIDGGKRLLGMTNIRRPGEADSPKSNVVAQSRSADGGFTWSAWRVVADVAGKLACEPFVLRSPSGHELCCLMRENTHTGRSLVMLSRDEARTWTVPADTPWGLTGDRHMGVRSPDGRWVIAFRDMAPGSPTHGHFVAWVGGYDDIRHGRSGQYRIKLLHSHAGWDCGYPGMAILPDGTVVATTYIKYRPGEEKHSVVSVRFSLPETDERWRALQSRQGSAGRDTTPGSAT